VEVDDRAAVEDAYQTVVAAQLLEPTGLVSVVREQRPGADDLSKGGQKSLHDGRYQVFGGRRDREQLARESMDCPPGDDRDRLYQQQIGTGLCQQPAGLRQFDDRAAEAVV
jgi:hypothetical protein